MTQRQNDGVMDGGKKVWSEPTLISLRVSFTEHGGTPHQDDESWSFEKTRNGLWKRVRNCGDIGS